MFYTSKLVAVASEKQEMAEMAALGFSEPLQQAMAMSDYFESIQAEEYVLPTVVRIRPRFESQDQPAHTSEYTCL